MVSVRMVIGVMIRAGTRARVWVKFRVFFELVLVRIKFMVRSGLGKV